MRRKIPHTLRAIVVAAIALNLTACANNPKSTSTLSGNSPLTAGNNAASGPLLDAWWDAGHSGLRTVYGVLGAAHQDLPTFSDGSYSGGAVCMQKDLALLTTSSGLLYSAVLPQGEPREVAGNGISKASVVFSPSCSASLIYVPGRTTALLVQGLLSNPTSTSVSLPAGNFLAAVADSGSVLSAISATNGSASIQLLASGTGSFQPVSVLGKFGGMSFLPGADTALFADASANTVVEASYPGGAINLTQLAAASNGVSQPIAVAVSADGQLAAVVNGTGSSVLRLDLSGKSAPVITICHCSPTELVPLAGNFAFRLTEPGSGTVWAFDGNSTLPRVTFIPTDSIATTKSAGTAQGGSL